MQLLPNGAGVSPTCRCRAGGQGDLAGTGEPLLLEPSGEGRSMLGDGDGDSDLSSPPWKTVGGRGDGWDRGDVGRLAPGEIEVGRPDGSFTAVGVRRVGDEGDSVISASLSSSSSSSVSGEQMLSSASLMAESSSLSAMSFAGEKSSSSSRSTTNSSRG